jgi:uncharacterized protein YciI
MKIVNHARYVADQDKVAELRPKHREYMTELISEGKLVAGGPFTDESGALFIYEAQSLEAAEAIVAADPYLTGGAFASYELRPWEVIKANPQLL